MVGAHAPQAQVGQALAKDCQFHQLGDVIYTFPQIAHVQHEDHARKGVMLYSFVVQCFQHIFVCVQAQIGIPGSVFQIPTSRTAGQKGLGIGKGLLQRLQMLGSGHAQLGTAALFVGLRHLQVAVGKLDDSGNRNAVIGTNITQHLRICAHGVQIDLQQRIMTIFHEVLPLHFIQRQQRTGIDPHGPLQPIQRYRFIQTVGAAPTLGEVLRRQAAVHAEGQSVG